MTTSFLAQQLADAKKNLDEQDAKLAVFQREHMGSLPEQAQTNLNILTELNSQLDAATQALSRAHQDKSFAESMLAQQTAAWEASQSGQSPDTLERQLAALQTQLASLEARYTDSYPDVIRTKHDIDVMRKKIAESNEQKTVSSPKKTQTAADPPQIAQLKGQIHSYDEVIAEKTKEQERLKLRIAEYQNRVQASPEILQQYKELTRGYQTALDSYNQLLRKESDATMATDLQRQRQSEQFSVLDPANLPDKASFRSVPKFVLGGFAGGLALGVGLVFGLEMKDTSMRSERDVEFVLRLPVLAMIPEVEPESGEIARNSSDSAPRAGSPLRLGTRA